MGNTKTAIRSGRAVASFLILLAVVVINYTFAARQVYAASCVSAPASASLTVQNTDV
jgi:hypothetical protein